MYIMGRQLYQGLVVSNFARLFRPYPDYEPFIGTKCVPSRVKRPLYVTIPPSLDSGWCVPYRVGSQRDCDVPLPIW